MSSDLQVSIHAPHGGATRSFRASSGRPMVSIHAPHGGRDLPDHMCPAVHQVSIHAPHGGRRPCRQGRNQTWIGFNPRAARGGRRAGTAPASDHPYRFNPRPARGATRAYDALMPRLIMFQSTRRTGGATRHICGGNYAICFNPRPARGATTSKVQSNESLIVFQSTRRTGGRHTATDYLRPKECCFNPRAARGARPDFQAKLGRSPPRVSIHAPHGGRDQRVGHPFAVVACFNPRAHGGRDSRSTRAMS